MRDPFLLAVPDGSYRLYGTTDPQPWHGPGTGFNVYASTDLRSWRGPITAFVRPEGFPGTTQFWAPEVHAWAGRWYMLATFADDDGRRGTYLLQATSPDGPFLPLGAEPITPPSWMCLDGTLHVDKRGDPWLVFCREWLEVTVGEIWAQRLAPDLTARTGEPHLLFRADEAPWSRPLSAEEAAQVHGHAFVTDGPFLHNTTDRQLVMIWSSRSASGYAVGVARSATGEVCGPWVHDPQPLWDCDGGHAMIARSHEQELILVLHAPNITPSERPLLLPLEDLGGKLLVRRRA